jgi:hypothetical protein
MIAKGRAAKRRKREHGTAMCAADLKVKRVDLMDVRLLCSSLGVYSLHISDRSFRDRH